jgi:hypothetical protein
MRKPIAFATLTPGEIDQIADLLDRETYDAVLTRICKPRSEGGFGLTISRSPLERLWAKKQILKKINSHIASGEKLTIATLDSFMAGESTPSDEAHAAILAATSELAKSGDNTPAQLLTLQRLADFPARAAIRDQRMELDLAKFRHKLDMDAFRKHIATARLSLARSRLNPNLNPNLFENIEPDSVPNAQNVQNPGRGTFHPCPKSTSRDALTQTDATGADQLRSDLNSQLTTEQNPVHPSNPENPVEKSASSTTTTSATPATASSSPKLTPDLKKLISDLIPSPCPLPPEIIEKNRAYAEKLRAGKIILDRSGPYVRDLEVSDTPTPPPDNTVSDQGANKTITVPSRNPVNPVNPVQKSPAPSSQLSTLNAQPNTH